MSSSSTLSPLYIRNEDDRIVTIFLETVLYVMAVPRLYKWAAGVLAAIVVAALVVALVVFLVKRSDNNDTADDDSAGSRVTESLKFVVFVSFYLFTNFY